MNTVTLAELSRGQEVEVVLRSGSGFRGRVWRASQNVVKVAIGDISLTVETVKNGVMTARLDYETRAREVRTILLCEPELELELD